MSPPVPVKATAATAGPAAAATVDPTDPEQGWAKDGTIDFRMIDVGPWDELCRRLRVREAMPRVMLWHALLPAALVWLPCLVLSTFVGPALDPAVISFLEDVSVHVRFLVLVPLLVLAEWDIGRQTRIAAAGFVVGGLVRPEERPRFEGNLPTVIEECFSAIEGILRRPARLVGHRFRTVSEYPEFWLS